jgi:hypothetical protein
MGCVVIGTGIIECDHEADPLHVRVYDVIHFEQTLSRAGSIWNRSLANPITFKQSDYFTESLNDPITFTDMVDWQRAKIRTLTSVISFLDSVDVSGGRVDTPPPDVSVSAIFDSTAQKGMAVYVSSSGHVDLAQADVESTSLVVGLADEVVIASNSGAYLTDDQVSRPDWTAVTGSATLTAGATYYLSATTAGQLTTTPPSADGDSVVRVGTALSTTTMDIEVAQPVLL